MSQPLLMPSSQVDLLCACKEIDAAWARRSYLPNAFPDVVEPIVEKLDLLPYDSLEKQLLLLGDAEVASGQVLQTFSDWYFKLYDDGRFWVEVLNWNSSDINIHDHDFAAIQVQLAGTSINVEYDFSETATHDSIAFGDYRIKRVSEWTPGSLSQVIPGRSSRHQVLHLSDPTVSLLFRTYPIEGANAQWNYFPPIVASQYFGFSDITFRMRAKALRILADRDTESFITAMSALTETISNRELLFLLSKLVDLIFESRFSGILNSILERCTDGVRSSIVDAIVHYRMSLNAHRLRVTGNRDDVALRFLAGLGACYDDISFKCFLTSLGVCEKLAIDVLDRQLLPVEKKEVQALSRSLGLSSIMQSCELMGW
jgi:hypothetical protein